jgi:hypothetical protein
MNSLAMADRSRVRLEVAVSPESATHFFRQPGGDVVADGIFIVTDREVAIGERVGVELALHAYVLFFRGTVRFRTTQGVGVTFDDISAPARRVIAAFCERRRVPVVYGDDGAPFAR